MHISWGWIKQRPQFVAEELAKSCVVDVYYRMSNYNKNGVNPMLNDGNLTVKGFRNWPFERLTFIPVDISYRINKCIWDAKGIDVNSYDYIWVTDPMLWWSFSDQVNQSRTKVIYDCMDDYSAFPYMDNYPKFKEFKERQEKELLKKADFVLVSAKALQYKLQERYGVDREYHVVNNAITQNIVTYDECNDNIELPEKSLVYIGTISEWFDFENTLKALEEYPELHVVLYGPKRMESIPKHDRLDFRGPIDHSNLLASMNKAKGLFMPFILNELIESVNPVKLYEYIYSGRPILATKYGETEPFSDYITLYSDYSEFSEFIRDKILSDFSINKEYMRKYALDNTWEARAKQIIKLIEAE